MGVYCKGCGREHHEDDGRLCASCQKRAVTDATPIAQLAESISLSVGGVNLVTVTRVRPDGSTEGGAAGTSGELSIRQLGALHGTALRSLTRLVDNMRRTLDASANDPRAGELYQAAVQWALRQQDPQKPDAFRSVLRTD
jgi:hypothetical protein